MIRVRQLLQTRWGRVVLVLGAVVAYLLAFALLYAVTVDAAALALLPVVVVGWLFGAWAGLLAGLLSILLNMLLFALVGAAAWDMVLVHGGPDSLLILASGVVVGRIHDLGERMKQELAARQQAEAALQAQQAAAAALAEIGRLISSSLDLREVYGQVAARMCQLVPCDFTVLATVDTAQDTLTIACATGHSAPAVGEVVPLRGTIPEMVIRTGRAVLIQGTHRTDGLPEAVRTRPALREGRHSLISVPLIAQGKVEGVLNLRARRPNAYAQHHLGLAERIGAQIAGAVANASAHAELRQAQAALAESEARYRAIVEHAPVGIAHGSTGVLQVGQTNQRFQQMLGYSAEELRQLQQGEFTHPDDLPKQQRLHEELLAGQRDSYQLEKRYIRKDGRVIWGNLHTAVVRDSTGKIQLEISMVEDITQRKQAEAALRASQQRTQQILETAHEAFIAIDAAGLVTTWNPQAEKTFGWSRAAAVGQPLTALIVPPQHRKAHRRGREHFLATGEGPVLNKRIEMTALHRDGHEFPIELTIAPLRVGESYVFNAFVHDITERKQAEQRERQLREEVLLAQADARAAHAADRLKSEFLTTVSHELRTPMASVLGFAELMLHRDFPSDRQRKFLQIIHDEAKRLTELISDVLDIQRLETGQMRFDFAPVALGEVIGKTVASHQGETTRHTLVTDVPAELPPVRADEGRLQEVLDNLVSNAIKYSPMGGEIRIVARQTGKVVQVSIHDQGMGVPAEALAQLFERFYRVPGSEREGIRGAGLGLALVQELVAAHGGRIWAESAGPGQGSSFHFTLPVMAAGALA